MPLEPKTWTRKDRGVRKTYVTGRLQRWEEIAMLSFLGLKNKEIAQKLHYDPSRVSIILQSAVVQRHLKELRTQHESRAVDVLGRFREMLTEKLDLPKKILDLTATVEDDAGVTIGVNDKILKLQKDTYFELADRIGFGSIKTINHNENRVISLKEIEQIRARALIGASEEAIVLSPEDRNVEAEVLEEENLVEA